MSSFAHLFIHFTVAFVGICRDIHIIWSHCLVCTFDGCVCTNILS